MNSIAVALASIISSGVIAFHLVTPPSDEKRYGSTAHQLQHRYLRNSISGTVGSYRVKHNSAEVQVSGLACDVCGHLTVNFIHERTGVDGSVDLDVKPWMDKDQKLNTKLPAGAEHFYDAVKPTN